MTCHPTTEHSDHLASHVSAYEHSNDSTTVLEVAGDYLDRGFCVLPQGAGSKRPAVRWKEYQERLPTLGELESWYQQFPDAGVAVVLGPVSNLFVIDVDGPDAHAELIARLGHEPNAPKVLSGSRQPCRYHLFFRHPDIATRAKITPWHPNLEFRGHRGLVVLPPSLHPKSGQPYVWAPDQSLDDIALTEVPAPVLDALLERAAHDGGAHHDVGRTGVTPAALTQVQTLARAYIAKREAAVEGRGGDMQTFTVACGLVLGFGLSPEQALPLMREYNVRCAPPWSDDELWRKLQEADKRSGPRGKLSARLSRTPTTSSVERVDQPPTVDGTFAANTRVPFLANIPDIVMIDPSQAKLFNLIGSEHGLFANTSHWPFLLHLKEDVEKGKYTDMASACRHASREFGGILGRVGDDRVAMRMAFDATCSCFRLVSFPYERVVACPGSHQSPSANKPPGASGSLADDLRQRAGQASRLMRLFRPAARLLWYIHGRVLASEQDQLVLADAELGAVLWGEMPTKWPANWRTTISRLLNCLSLIFTGRWLLGDSLNFDGHRCLINSVVNRRKEGGVQNDQCCPACCLWHSPIKHGHFQVEIGEGFLGSLERFRLDHEGEQIFGFHPKLRLALEALREDMLAQGPDFLENPEQFRRQQQREIRAAEKKLRADHQAMFKGVIFAWAVPMVFSDLLRLTAAQKNLLLAMAREVTHATRRRQSQRPDRAHVFTAGRVPAAGRDAMRVCRLLQDMGPCIGLNGNGRKGRWGRGYKLRTWMARTGYVQADGSSAWQDGLTTFLCDVSGLGDLLGITAVGVLKDEDFDIEQLREMARSGLKHDLRRLADLCLRFYLAADYLDRWRQLVAGQLGGAPVAPGAATGDPLLKIRVAMVRQGISQQKLAEHLGEHRTTVNKWLRGKLRKTGLIVPALEFLRPRP